MLEFSGLAPAVSALGFEPIPTLMGLSRCLCRSPRRVYRRTGKQQQAQEHLTTATTMYREMDMPYWLEQAEAEPKGMA